MMSALYFVFSIFVLLIARSISRAAISSLRSVPGPLAARFTRLWYLKEVWTSRFIRTNIELHQKYGPIVRIAPNEYSIDDPAAIKPLYGHGTTYVKGPWYKANASPDLPPNLFSESNIKAHAGERRKFSMLFSMSTMVSFEDAVTDTVLLLQERLSEFGKSGKAIDLQWWMQCYAFDTIGSITIAKRFGMLDAGQDKMNVIAGLDQFLLYGARVGVYAELHPFLFQLTKLAGDNPLVRIIEFTRKQLAKYQEEKFDGSDGLERHSLLEKALRMHQEQPDKFSIYDVLQTCLISVVAGSDTTSITLTAVMWFLLKNPDVLKKLRAEVDQKYDHGEIADPISYAQSQQLPYLQAVIKEALRLHPAGGLPYSRVVPKGGTTLAGHFFPEGSLVGINPWVAHHNKQVFGEDAKEFRPERWLVDKESGQVMDRYWIPYGHGSRTCIGKNVAHMEISKLIPQLVRKFDFSLKNPDAQLETYNVWFVKQKDVVVNIGARKH